MTSNTLEPFKDEVSLIELWYVVWEGKLVVLAFSLLGLFFGALYLIFLPDRYSGTLEIWEPDREIISTFAPVNDQIKEQYEEYEEATKVSDSGQNQFEIVSAKLLDDFVREFQDGEELEAAMQAHSAYVQSMSDQQYQKQRLLLLSDFQMSLEGNGIKRGVFKFDWHDEVELSKILASTFSKMNDNVKTANLRRLEALMENLKLRRTLEVAKLTQRLKVMAETIDASTQRTLLILDEQAAIARELGVEDNASYVPRSSLNVLQTVDEKNTDELEDTFDFDDTFDRGHLYLRGYKAIEKEAALIRARERELRYTSNAEYLKLMAKLSGVENDIAPDQLYAVINASLFTAKSDLFPVNTQNINIESNKDPLLTLILALLLGIAIGSACVLMRHASKDYLSKQAI